MRQTLGQPKKIFTESLRKRLLADYIAEYDQLYARLKFHRSNIAPSDTFRKKLRHNLVTPERKQKPIFIAKRRFWVRTLEVTGSLVTVFALITATVFFGTRPATLATEGTVVTSFNGEVEISRNGASALIATPDFSLTAGARLATGTDASATIRFFEDSLIRLDAETVITIDYLEPHSVREDLGEVEISIIEGRVWVRTFSTDENFSRFAIALSEQDEIVMDSGGAADITVTKAVRSVRVWERSLLAVSNGVSALLSEGRKFMQRGSFNSGLTPIAAEDYDEAWVQANFAKDSVVIAALLQQKIAAQELLAENRVESLRERFISPFSENVEAEIFALETDFFAALSDILAYDDDAALQRFIINSRTAAEDHAEEVIALLASSEKTLSIVLPDSPLFTAKTSVEDLKLELEAETEAVAAEKRRTERLWEARKLARSGNVPLAEEIIRENSETAATPEAITPQEGAEILEEKQEQLAALSGMVGVSEIEEGVVETLEKETITKSSRIIRPGFPDKSKTDSTDKAYAVVGSIKKYESSVGQVNTLRHHLNKISNSAENLALLVEIKNRVPSDLVGMVDEKIITILGEERENVVAAETPNPAPTAEPAPAAEVNSELATDEESLLEFRTGVSSSETEGLELEFGTLLSAPEATE